ncbi:hypothetical protein RvY_09758 [Ramazzottius varieornatus]|uniref:Thioredoxin domain-containing protein n=1 Tax=Ramazzottius varieornatus TaxID=947166 RepID=A0A1D1VAG7_RAMVA|nr:hypothetical protein RvY_09758 [Ramazzottius varieornatus]
MRVMWPSCLLAAIILAMSCLSCSAATNKKDKPNAIVHPLDESNWTAVMDPKGEWMVEFIAPWCPACKDFAPEFQRLAEWNQSPHVKFASVDVHEQPGLSGRFLITALPTVYHIKDGVVRYYNYIRDRERMSLWLAREDWFKVNPVGTLLYPDSIQMGLVGSFFKLSMNLKNVHSWMTEDKGMPNWLTYVIFAIGTVALGGVIGVLLVVVIEAITGRKNTNEIPIHWPTPTSKLQFESKEDKEALRKKTDQSGGDSPATSATNTDEEDNLAEATDEKSGTAKQKSDNEMLGSATGTDEEGGSKMEAGDKAVRRRKARREE